MAFEVATVINRDAEIWHILKALPKIELHRHLEGTIRLSTLLDVGRKYVLPLPTYDAEALRQHVQVTAHDTAHYEQFLSKFSVLRQFFVSEEVIRRVAREAVEDAAADNIRYMELRFTPFALAKLRGFPLSEVVSWVVDTVNTTATEHNMLVNLIVAMNRHESVQIGRQMLETALEFAGKGVVGIDLCGNEVGFPATPFIDIFREAHRAGLGVTIHAGEWEGAPNVLEAIEHIQASRIGHGVRAIEDSRALHAARELDIIFEVCPTSNLQTGVAASIGHYQLTDLYYLDARVTINTDDPAICNTTLTDEYALVVQGLGLPLEYIKTCLFNCIQAAFLPQPEKTALETEFREAFSLLQISEPKP